MHVRELDWSTIPTLPQIHKHGLPPGEVPRGMARAIHVAQGILWEITPFPVPEGPSLVGLAVSVDNPDVPLARPRMWRRESTCCEWRGDGYWAGMMEREIMSQWLAGQGFEKQAMEVLVRKPGTWVCLNDPHAGHIWTTHLQLVVTPHGVDVSMVN